MEPGTVVDTRSGKLVTPKEIASAARHVRFVYLGEQHATAAHQRMHADIVTALAEPGRPVAVGLEMLTRPKQDVLDLWWRGTAPDAPPMQEAAFLQQVDWGREWGFDFGFYRPLFLAVQQRKIPTVALNVPREWVRQVGREGFDALPTSVRMQLPPKLDLGLTQHRRVFTALMGGHPMTGARAENIYSAQVLWDEGMADTALKFLERANMPKNAVFVVVAGAGHVMYDQGINARIARKRGGTGLSVVMIESPEPVTVRRGLADFVYVSRPEPKPSPTG